ncbi:MAG: transporter [Burkholderiaceae bacterium]|nr:MAG: transporter [Burkholderiaceae bacterium]
MRRFNALATAALGIVMAGAPLAALATDLLDVWHAASTHDPDVAVSQAVRDAGDARRAQASALWRPTVTLTGNVARMSADSRTTGANFSTPAFGQSNGVDFNTSINDGNASGWTLEARQPLISRERQARSRQLEISANAADLEWQSARQDLMLHTVQRYFAVVLARRKLELLRQQHGAVEKALAEAKDRFALGDAPVTDTYEASARAQNLRAQVLVADNELQLAQTALSDATGLVSPSLQTLPPAANVVPAALPPLAHWLALASDGNPLLRMQQTKAQVAHEETVKLGATSSATLDLVAQTGQQHLNGVGDFGPANNTTRQSMIGVQLTIPLYTGGYRSAHQQEAVHLEDKALAEVELSRQQISQQTRAAWLGLQAGDARIGALAEAVKASRARLDATQLGRQVGDRTTLDLLNAESDTSSAELALLQAKVDVLLDQLRLQALTGQLDEARLEAVNTLLHY